MEPDRSPAQLIADSEGLLLDFDGPVCDLYAGSDPAYIARGVATAFDLDLDTNDPLDLITHALAHGGPVDEIHQALTTTEVDAARTATETAGIRQLIESYQGPIAIVSNNASEAIVAWLAAAGLQHLVEVVTGRDPRHMKPDPRVLEVSARAIDRRLNRCIFVGDSLTDARAAHEAGTPIIALANRPQKRQLFSTERCAAIVDSIYELTPTEPVIPSTG